MVVVLVEVCWCGGECDGACDGEVRRPQAT